MAHVLIWVGMNISIHGGILYNKYVSSQNCVDCTVSSAYCTSLSFLHIAVSFIMVTVSCKVVFGVKIHHIMIVAEFLLCVCLFYVGDKLHLSYI